VREDQAGEASAGGTAPGTLRGAGAAEEYVQRRTQDGVAVLTLAGPGGNRFSLALVHALERAFAVALHDPGVRAVVITARGPDFCAGPHADLPPPNPEPSPLPPVLDALAGLCLRIAHSPRPVVCALHGRVASGGLALALAAHSLLADARAQLHFPERRLALLPPGNGAVRLAWRLGAAQALAFLRADRPMSATQAQDAGLIERIESEALLPAAIAQAEALAMSHTPLAESGGAQPGLRDGTAFRAAIAAARAALPDPLPAHRRHEALLIDAVEVAQLLPPDQALAFDLVHAQDAATAPPARALAHLSRAARRVLDTPEARAAGTPPPHRASPLAVALAPAEAALLVPPLLRAGERVVLIQPDTESLTRALEAVAEAQLAAVASGALAQGEADDDWARLDGGLAPAADPPPGLALAAPLFAQAFEAQLPADCPLLLWSARGPLALARPHRAVTLAPAPVRNRTGLPQLVEVIVQPGLVPLAVQRATDLVLSLHVTPLRVAGAAIVPDLLQAARQAARRLRALGVPADAIRATALLPAAALLPEGEDPGVTGTEEIIALPLPVDRLIVLALVNAGAKLLERAQVLRPSDIDIAMVLGAGYPNWRGGPMAEGDGLGLLVLRHELLLAAGLDGALWTPAPLIDELIRQGWRFEDLNAD